MGNLLWRNNTLTFKTLLGDNIKPDALPVQYKICSQGDLHEQLKTAKKEAKESGEARTRAEAELEELRDRVEEMALDKEMAEEMKECAELGR